MSFPEGIIFWFRVMATYLFGGRVWVHPRKSTPLFLGTLNTGAFAKSPMWVRLMGTKYLWGG